MAEDAAVPPPAAFSASVLLPGSAEGPVLVLEEALSFWGGVDPETGEVVDRRHPQRGMRIGGHVLVLPTGRGSSSSSTVLAEAIRNGTGPAAVLLGEADPILALGALVAAELYGTEVPVVVVPEEAWDGVCRATAVRVERDGTITLGSDDGRGDGGGTEDA